jgi:WD40 repeat protein
MEILRKLPRVRIGICALIFFSVLGCEKEQQKTQVPPSSGGDEVLAATTPLSTIEAQEKPEGNGPSSGSNPSLVVVFNERGRGVAYVAQKEGLLHIVHNGKAGRLVTAVDQLSISPDGKRIAYSAQVDGKWRMVIDDKVGVLSDEVNDPVFSPDSRHIAYQARIAEKWHMVVDDTMSPGCPSYLGKPLFSADSTKIVYVEKINDKGQLRLIVSDLVFKTQNKKKFTGGQLIANADKTRIAAVKITGKKQCVIEFSFDRPDAVKEAPKYESVSRLVFGSDGVSLAYVAERGGTRLLVLNGKEERLIDGDLMSPPVVRPDNKGVGALMSVKGGYFLHQAFFHDGTKGNKYDEAAELVYSKDSTMHAYSARKGNNWFIVANGKEGPVFDRVVTPVFSPDSKLLVYRARKDGKRFVVVADASGNVLRQHPSYEQVFQPVFTADGKSVAYGVKDGQKLIWKVEKL